MAIPNHYQPRPTHATQVFTGEIFNVWQWEQKQYDGSTKTFERLQRSDTTHTVGVLPDQKILLTHDEQPDRHGVLTPPGGRIEIGESPADAAQRELREETGYTAGELIPWHTYHPSSKIDWTVHAFIGRQLTKVAEPTPEPGERIDIRTFTFEEFLALGHNPAMRDLIIRLILLEALLNPAKQAELKQLLYG